MLRVGELRLRETGFQLQHVVPASHESGGTIQAGSCPLGVSTLVWWLSGLPQSPMGRPLQNLVWILEARAVGAILSKPLTSGLNLTRCEKQWDVCKAVF